MSKIWVVESQFSNGEWAPCSFTENNYVSRGFKKAHILKDKIRDHLVGSVPHVWNKKRFRVVEYQITEKYKNKTK